MWKVKKKVNRKAAQVLQSLIDDSASSNVATFNNATMTKTGCAATDSNLVGDDYYHHGHEDAHGFDYESEMFDNSTIGTFDFNSKSEYIDLADLACSDNDEKLM